MAAVSTTSGRTRLSTPATIRRGVWRHRRHLAPALAWPAGAAVHTAATGSTWPMTCVLTAGVGVIAAAEWRGKPWGVRWAAAFTSWCAADFVTGGMPVRWSMAAWLGIAVPWWVRVQYRGIPAQPSSAPRPRAIDLLRVQWAERVSCRGGKSCDCSGDGDACKGGVLPGVTLTDVTPMPDVEKGFQGTLTFSDLTLAEAQARQERLLVALRLPRGSVEIAAHPTGNADQARIYITPINPLRQVAAFTGPTLIGGSYAYGPSLSGPPALVRLDDDAIGPVPLVIAGAQGSGKSGVTKGLLAELHLSPVHVTWLIDPQQGASHPEFRGVVDWFGPDLETARVMLRAALRVMAAREKFMADLEHSVTVDMGDGPETITVRGVDVFAPRPGLPMMTPEFPEVRIVIEEAPVILADNELASIIAQILKRGRKTGVSVALISQLLAQTEFGDPAVRPLVTSGSRIVCRTSDTLAARQASGGTFTVNPSALPQTWPDGSSTAGLAYVQAGGADPVLARSRWTSNWWAWSRRPRAGQLDALSVAAVNADADVYGRQVDEGAKTIALPSAAPHAQPATQGQPTARDLMLAAITNAPGPVSMGEWLAIAGVGNPETGRSARQKLVADGLVTQIPAPSGRSQDIRYEAVKPAV